MDQGSLYFFNPIGRSTLFLQNSRSPTYIDEGLRKTTKGVVNGSQSKFLPKWPVSQTTLQNHQNSQTWCPRAKWWPDVLGDDQRTQRDAHYSEKPSATPKTSQNSEDELSTSMEMKKELKPKSPKPTGGLMIWKSSCSTWF